MHRLIFLLYVLVGLSSVWSTAEFPSSSTKWSSNTGGNALLDESPSSHLKTGTTIVGLSCRDGVVLAADTRSTSGPMVMDKDKLKIHQISPRIFSCAAGTSADCDQLTRGAGQTLALQRLERKLAGMNEQPWSDRVTAARASLLGGLRTSPGGSDRVPSAVFLLGGVDDRGPSLHQIESDGLSQEVRFSALGSGSLDAIAILETELRRYSMQHQQSEVETGEGVEVGSGITTRTGNKDGWVDICVDEAIPIVRRAVRAGIMNDLGSGSHVDICVIQARQVRRWREEMRALGGIVVDRDEGSVPVDTGAGSAVDADVNRNGNEEGQGLGRVELPTPHVPLPQGRRQLGSQGTISIEFL